MTALGRYIDVMTATISLIYTFQAVGNNWRVSGRDVDWLIQDMNLCARFKSKH